MFSSILPNCTAWVTEDVSTALTSALILTIDDELASTSALICDILQTIIAACSTKANNRLADMFLPITKQSSPPLVTGVGFPV